MARPFYENDTQFTMTETGEQGDCGTETLDVYAK